MSENKNTYYFKVVVIIIFSIIGLNFASAETNQIKIPQGTINADGITKLVISENDFNQLAQEVIAGQLNGIVKSASIKIFDGYAEVAMVTQKPIKATLFVRGQVNVANNKLYPKILKMRYGFMPVPNFIINFLIGKVAGQNSQNFQSNGIETPGVEWRSVDFKKGEATIEFKEVVK